MLLEYFGKMGNMHLQSFFKFGIPIMILFVYIMSSKEINFQWLMVNNGPKKVAFNGY